MTKEEFKRRWEKDERGDGITFNDIADCAKEWGLYQKPKTEDINKVLNAVLKAANVKEETEQKKEGVKTMAQKILILGNSGTGKSASMRNFKSDEVIIQSKPRRLRTNDNFSIKQLLFLFCREL